MTKKAIIIVSPLYQQAKGYAPGVKVDAVNWYRFFLSATGGGFYKWEITLLVNPSVKEIMSAVKENKTYSTTIVYSGHGSYSVQASNTILKLNHAEQIPLTKLMGNSAKELFIINCCRNLDYSNFTGIGDPDIQYLNFPSYLTTEQARRAHESKLLELKNGIGVIFAASVGESSWTNARGSYFCDAILTTMRNWATHHEPMSILNSTGALNFSKQLLKRYGIKQTPEFKRSHNHVNFPLAIRYGTEMNLLRQQALYD